MKTIATARQFYIGGLTAQAMAVALFNASGLDHPCNTGFRRQALIGKPLRSLSAREQGARFAEFASKELAANIDEWQTWSNGDEVIQRQIDLIQLYTKESETGLDPFNGLNERREEMAMIMMEIRRLRNDGKRLIALAMAMLDDAGIDRLCLIGEAMNVVDYSSWAEEKIGNVL